MVKLRNEENKNNNSNYYKRILAAFIIGTVITIAPILGATTLLPMPTVQNAWASSCPGENGKIAFTSTRDSDNYEIYVMNPDGSSQTRLTNDPAVDRHPSWSPDGTKIAFGRVIYPTPEDPNEDIYVMNADGSGQTKLTDNPSQDSSPSWSPDGTKIAFTTIRDGNVEVYVMNADGSGQTNISNNPATDAHASWSPDGTKIAFVSHRDGGDPEIYVMNADGSSQTNISNNPGAGDGEPKWSPDGNKIVFHSDRDGNAEIYVMNADGSSQTNISNNPAAIDSYGSWSPDGEKIVFSSREDASFSGIQLFVMNTDGSFKTMLTNEGVNDFPDWGTAQPWILKGFYSPIDMSESEENLVFNTAKVKSAIPAKLEIFIGDEELTSTEFNGEPVGEFTLKKIDCISGAADTDAIEELVTTREKGLRYDTDAGQFVNSIQLKNTGCYELVFEAQDGTTFEAQDGTRALFRVR